MSHRTISTYIRIVMSICTIPAFVYSQYSINYHDVSSSYCLSIGHPINTDTSSPSINNGTTLFWSAYSVDNPKPWCISWRLEDHYDHDTDDIYYGKFFVNKIGFHETNVYFNDTLQIDPTIRFHALPQKMPFTQNSQSVGYDAGNNNIVIIGGQGPPTYAMVIYHIDTDSYTDHSGINGSYGINYFERSFGEAWIQINNTLFTTFPSTFKLNPYEYTEHWAFGFGGLLGGDKRFSCLTSINDSYLVIAGGEEGFDGVGIYDFARDVWLIDVPSMLVSRETPSCKVVNNYFYVIGGDKGGTGRNTVLAIEKLYVGDLANISQYSFHFTSANLSLSTNDKLRTLVVNDFILILGSKEENVGTIQILDTMTDTISDIGYLGIKEMASILVGNIIYLFGGIYNWGNYNVSDDTKIYDLTENKNAQINNDVILRGNDMFEIDLSSNSGVLSHRLFGGIIDCKLAKYGDQESFMLYNGDTNPTVDGYQATFLCNEEPAMNVTVELYTMKPTTDPTLAPSMIPTNEPTHEPTGYPTMMQMHNLIIENHQDIEVDWVAFYLRNVDLSCDGSIIDVSITDNFHYQNKWLHFDRYQYKRSSVCLFTDQNAVLTVPITVKITRYYYNKNETIIATDVITSFIASQSFDVGENFCDGHQIEEAVESTDTPSNHQTNAPSLYNDLDYWMEHLTFIIGGCVIALCCICICWMMICAWCCSHCKDIQSEKNANCNNEAKIKNGAGELEKQRQEPGARDVSIQLSDIARSISLHLEMSKQKTNSDDDIVGEHVNEPPLFAMDSGLSDGMYEKIEQETECIK